VTVAATTFAQIMSAFPTGVTVITATGEDGDPWGLTSNAIASVSADPPMLLVCVAKTSRTLPALIESRGFLVNFMGEGSEHACRRFASKVPSAEKFDSVTWRWSASGRPHLHVDSVAYADCVMERHIEAGTHRILVGRIVDGAVTDTTRPPLAYVRRAYRSWPRETSAADERHV
jgi:flavin reductase (NADH)